MMQRRDRTQVKMVENKVPRQGVEPQAEISACRCDCDTPRVYHETVTDRV